MKFEKNYANLSIPELTNTKHGILNRKNTGGIYHEFNFKLIIIIYNKKLSLKKYN